jgi:hypothetical protein
MASHPMRPYLNIHCRENLRSDNKAVVFGLARLTKALKRLSFHQGVPDQELNSRVTRFYQAAGSWLWNSQIGVIITKSHVSDYRRGLDW